MFTLNTTDHSDSTYIPKYLINFDSLCDCSLVIFSSYVHVCECVQVSTGMHRGQKCPILLELELQAVVSTWCGG